MDAARINSKIWAGRGKAALRIGYRYRIYRPDSAVDPLANYISTLKAGFNAADNVYAKPNLYGKPVWFADVDGRYTQPGDYLVRDAQGASPVYFIAAQQSLLPIIAIDCPRKLFIQRRPCGSDGVVGATTYSGLADPIPVLGSASTPWPAAIFIGGRVQASTGLPGGVREAAWTVLLPPSVPVTLQSGDLITDDQGRRMAIESAELSDLGWRLMATEVHT